MDGCGDHGCAVKKPHGQGTNGGCRCKPEVLRACIAVLKAERDSLAERLERAIEALRTYGSHHSDCDRVGVPVPGHCNCGLGAAILELVAPAPPSAPDILSPRCLRCGCTLDYRPGVAGFTACPKCGHPAGQPSAPAQIVLACESHSVNSAAEREPACPKCNGTGKKAQQTNGALEYVPCDCKPSAPVRECSHCENGELLKGNQHCTFCGRGCGKPSAPDGEQPAEKCSPACQLDQRHCPFAVDGHKGAGCINRKPSAPAICGRCEGTGNFDPADSGDDRVCPKCGGSGKCKPSAPESKGGGDESRG